MSVVEIALTAEQLASAYLQLNEQERRGFLEAVFSHPAQQHIALELLIAAQAVLQQKFSPHQQRLLDRLLDKNNGRGATTSRAKTACGLHRGVR